jgi:hypothetical protein
MMRALSMMLCLLLTRVASAAPAPVQIPAGARWFVTAPNAARFAREAEALLTSAGGLSPSLIPRRMNDVWLRSYGVGLLQLETLESSGIDTAQPWMLFERAGAEYLSVMVKDRARLTAALEQWGARRLLRQRDETRLEKPKGAVMVTFARAQGTRAAAGYLIADDRAIVMVKPAERDAALVAAYDAIEGAAPVQPGVDGTLLMWLGNESALRDGWLAFTGRADGVDLLGAARQVEAGFIDREGSHADWIRALTAAPAGQAGDVPLWARVLAGSKTGNQLITAFGRLIAEQLAGAGAKPWMDHLRSLSQGPLEFVATSVDVKAVERAEGGGLREDLLRLTHPSLLFVDRSAAAGAADVKLAKAALCEAQPLGDDAVRAGCADPGLTVGQSGRALFLGWTGSLAKPASPPTLSGSPTYGCAKGTPIASVRFSPSVVGDAMRQVGLLDAMSSQSLAGMLAVGSEYGRLMQASQPALGLACAESSGRVTVQGRWRFTPAP